jgi:hypothetical protein
MALLSFGQGRTELEGNAAFFTESAPTTPARRMSYAWGSVFGNPADLLLEDSHMHLDVFRSMPMPLLFGITGLLFVIAVYFLWVRRRSGGSVK